VTGRAPAATVLETARLTLRRLTVDDAPFILGLLNEPSFVRFIGDKRVRTLDDAREYIEQGPMASYEQHGFGLYLTSLTQEDTPIGICGLLKREVLDDVDIGFALVPPFWSQGYAHEAATAVLDYGRNVLRLERVVAVANPDNAASIRLLEKLGLRFSRMARLAAGEPELKLFSTVA
jgi:[ribosomal protein S5]-alanine N-acetyltransferase